MIICKLSLTIWIRPIAKIITTSGTCELMESIQGINSKPTGLLQWTLSKKHNSVACAVFVWTYLRTIQILVHKPSVNATILRNIFRK